MSILNLNGPAGRSPRGKRAVKVWMGIGLVIAVLGVGSTLASTITINGNTNQEFGQGVQRTVYCGGKEQIKVTPISSYTNVPEPVPLDPGETAPDGESETSKPSEQDLAGSFHFSGIKVTDVPRKCSGVNFVFSIFDQSGSQTAKVITSREGGNPISFPTVYWYDNPQVKLSNVNYGGILSDNREFWREAPDQMSFQVLPGYEEKGAFIITFSGGDFPSIDDVGRIVVETQNDTIYNSAPVNHPLIIPILPF
jgi:hypothetical protein